MCVPTSIDVHFGPTVAGVIPGSSTAPIVFTNTSNAACYLDAVPTVQPVARHSSLSLVSSGGLIIGARDDFVLLGARSGMASVTFEMLSLSTFVHATYASVIMNALRVEFQTAPTITGSTPSIHICSQKMSTMNAGVVTGVVNNLNRSA